MSRQGGHHKKSMTRSETMKGRDSLRKGERQAPRQSLVVGLPVRPKPDPNLRPWPRDCVTIVSSTPWNVNVRSIKGRIMDHSCADCGTRLAVDSRTIDKANAMPERDGRPLRFICGECCVTKYDMASIQKR